MLCEGCELEEDDPALLAAKVSLGVLDVVYQVLALCAQMLFKLAVQV